jgi:sn-glycerol 3-phosphate transport system substrate-binding protein
MTNHGQKLFSASAFAICAASAATAEVQVEFWHSFGGSGGEALDAITADVERANPDIDIVTEHVGNYSDIVTKLQAAIPASRGPDAVILEVTRYGLFADSGVLLDLTSFLDADPLKADLLDYAREVGV